MGPRLAILLLLALLVGGCAAPRPSSPLQEEAEAASQRSILRGSAVDEDFKALRGILIEVTPGARMALTGADGAFQFRDLEPGAYRVEASHQDWNGGAREEALGPGETRTLTFFLTPKVPRGPSKTVTELDGIMTCTVASAQGYGTGGLTCPPAVATLGLGPGWAATVTEIVWGQNGTSSTRESLATLRPAQGSGVYAAREGTSPLRFQMLPGQVHEAQGGNLATPRQGALVLELQKEPARLWSDLRLGVTVRESFHVYHTTFFDEAPAELDSYSARR